MTLSKNILATGLLNSKSIYNFKEAGVNFTEVWFDYISAMTGAGIPINKSALYQLKPIMVKELINLNSTQNSIRLFQNGIVAVWEAMIPITSTLFVGTIPPLTPPPGITGIHQSLVSLVVNNPNLGLNKKKGATLLANRLHTITVAGGTVTLPGPPPIIGPIL